MASDNVGLPPRLRKEKHVAQIKATAEQSDCLIVAHNSGMTVKQFEQLRNSVREAGVTVSVQRNKLVKLAFKDTQFACADESLKGPTLLMFSKGELAPLAKLANSFKKDNKEKFDVIALVAESECHGGAELGVFASLPTRHEALSMLVGTLQAPVSKFVRTTKEPVTKLVRTFAAVAEKKQ